MEPDRPEELEVAPSGQYAFSPLDKVLFGPGSVEGLPAEVDALGAERVLLVTGSSIASQTDLVAHMQQLLGDRVVEVFSGARQHAPATTILDLESVAERSHADAFVSLGGGSVIDTAKAAILALARDSGEFLPHICLPTTLSAAEFSPFFGVTDDETRTKKSTANNFVTPRTVILDVELAAHTPDWLWYASGVRALDHAVETVYAPNHQPATDATALEAIRLLRLHLPGSGQPDLIAARQQCQIAAWLSFFGVQNITLGLSHALGREIGPKYDIPHGYTSAILLPHVMSHLLPVTAPRQALIAGAMGVAPAIRAQSEVALEAPPAVSGFVRQLGLPERLRDVGVPEPDLDGLAGGRPEVLRILGEAW